jgi:hypothetical protein
MVSDQNAAGAQIEATALTSKAHASTYCLIDLTTGANGTVVAVNIGSRYFLATAAHVIPASHDFKVVVRDSIDGVYDFAARNVHPELDIGLLELLPKDIPRFHDTFVPANAIMVRSDQGAEYNVTVVGYPHKLIDQVDRRPLSPNETVEVHQCNAFTFHSVALPLSEWPSSGTKTPPVPGIDIFIDFNPEDSVHLIDAKKSGDTPFKIAASAPHPAGVSGGGIWLLQSSTSNTLWQPVAHLHAIQFGFHPSGWLRGALIDTWLEVVDNNYPDLKSEIRQIRQRPNPVP